MTSADAEIRTLLARIAQVADSGDLDEYVALFTDDAVWAMPDNPVLGLTANEKRGTGEIRAGVEERRAGGVQGPGSGTRHVLTTTAVFVESDKRATARSYFQFYGDTTSQPVLRNVGQYDDVLVRGEHGWQLAYRTITFG
jgi:3-phenylpropionate/cinnamic acid dioxygenase small subunit